MNNPTAQVYRNVFFLKQNLHSDDVEVEEPRRSETKWRKCATSIVELVLCRQLTAAAGSNVAFPCFLSLFAL